MRFVDNGVPEDFARLCFTGMTVPLCELSEEEYMEVVFGVKGYKTKPKRGGGYIQEKIEVNPVIELSIEDLELSQRPSNCLKRAGIDTIAQLCDMTEAQLRRIRNMGEKSVKEVKEKLADMNCSLKSENEA